MMHCSLFRCLPLFCLAATLPVMGGVAVGAPTTSQNLSKIFMEDEAVEAPATSHSFSKPFIEAAKRAQPGVVSVKSRMKKSTSHWQGEDEMDQFGPEEFWERFFGVPMPEQRPRQQKPRFAYGSGFIVSKDGYILTNNHVVERSDAVTITLPDGTEHAAKVIGTDPSTDIAVVHIDATDLPALTLADSSSVEVGEWVLAVGNPFGLQESVTAGIISAKGRSDLDIVRVEQFFQTDAAINMGNSGGPLVNLRGDVIGMNTAIASSNGGHMGIGFAIPSNLLSEVMQTLIQYGRVTRGYLGVALQRVDADIAVAVGLDKPQGALVSEVLPGGPAEKAGLQSGDVILELSGKKIEGLGAFRSAVMLMKPGEEAVMKIRRNGQDMTISAAISENPENEAQGASVEETTGLMLEPVTSELAKRYNLDTKTGLLIVKIDTDSLAYQVGLRGGHVILAVNGRPVSTVDEFARTIQSVSSGGRLLLQVKVGQSIRFVPLTIE
jgi:serine protease Do